MEIAAKERHAWLGAMEIAIDAMESGAKQTLGSDEASFEAGLEAGLEAMEIAAKERLG